jgi:CubicO group peptidase (beta-lactamase class C family)
MHVMVDRGLLDYEDRVARYWPEFGQAGKGEITVRHVLAHQSGLYHIRQMIDHADRMLDWEHMVRAIERAEPVHPPGRRTGYHGLTYGFLVGEILQRVSGMPFPELVRETLAEPLALDGMFVGTPESELGRAAELIWPQANELLARLPLGIAGRWLAGGAELASAAFGGVLRAVGIDFDLASLFDALAPRGISSFDFGSPESLRVAIPAGNGLFTARSLARMYATLANGGELDGVRLLSRATLDRATEEQTEGPGRSVLPFDMRWRLGYHGVFTTRGAVPNAFGHFGFGGSGAWADASRNLAVGLIVNAGMGTPFGDMRIARLSGSVIRSAVHRTRTRERKAAAAEPPGALPHMS